MLDKKKVKKQLSEIGVYKQRLLHRLPMDPTIEDIVRVGGMDIVTGYAGHQAPAEHPMVEAMIRMLKEHNFIKDATDIGSIGIEDSCPETCAECELDPVSCGHFSI